MESFFVYLSNSWSKNYHNVMKRGNDMRKISKQITKLVAVIIVVAILVLAAGISFVSQSKQGLEDEKINYLKEISIKSADSLEQQILGHISMLEAIATFIGSHEEFDVQHSLPILKVENNRNMFKRMGIILSDGTAYTTDDRVLDLGNRDYFKEAMSGEAAVSSSLVDVEDGSEINVFAAPIHHKDEVVGVIFATMSRELFTSSLDIDIFQGEGYSYVITSSGFPVVRTTNSSSLGYFENFYDEMAKVGIDESKIEQMKSDLSSSTEGVMSYYREGIEKQLCYAAIGINDWFVVTIIPSTVISFESDRLIMHLTLLTIVVIALTVVTCFIMIRYFQNNNKHLEIIAYTDKVTGCSNWDKFVIDVTNLMMMNPNKKYCIVDLDINKFKVINDMFGHDMGDRVLRHLVDVLMKNIQAQETFARVASDHFNLFLSYESDDLIIQRMKEIERNVANMIDDYIIEVSMGIYTISEYTNDISMLSDRAAVAKNIAKKSNDVSYHFFREENRNEIIKEKEIENIMDISLENKEFEVFLQPKYSLGNERIVGAEALVRWKHDGKDYIYPNDFIPLFEKNGFIRKLDLYMFESVCKLIQSWKQIHHKDWTIPISVNISRVHLSRKNLPQKLIEIAKKYDIDPKYIEIELTESALFSDEENMIETMSKIKAGGFSISIDDFGSGYSSLSTLKDLPADIVKIDKCFLDKAIDDLRGKEIIRSIVLMTKGLGLRSIAEGVEDITQVQFLREVGCDMAQGYYYSKAISVSEFMKLIEE